MRSIDPSLPSEHYRGENSGNLSNDSTLIVELGERSACRYTIGQLKLLYNVGSISEL